MKVATLQNWITDRGQKIYKDELVFPNEEDNKKLTDGLDVFEVHFTALQSMIQSWYNLGALEYLFQVRVTFSSRSNWYI